MTNGFRDFQAKFRRGVQQGLRDVGEQVLAEANGIVSREAIDRGDLLKSGEVKVAGPNLVQVVWTASHAPHVEYGTRPHWPPLKPVLEWVKRNFRIQAPQAGAQGPERGVFKPRRKAGTRKAHEDELLRVARAVQAKIAAVGTEPVRFARRGSTKVAPRAAGIMETAIRRALHGGAGPGP